MSKLHFYTNYTFSYKDKITILFLDIIQVIYLNYNKWLIILSLLSLWTGYNYDIIYVRLNDKD